MTRGTHYGVAMLVVVMLVVLAWPIVPDWGFKDTQHLTAQTDD